MLPASHKHLTSSGVVKAQPGELVAFQITGGDDAATVTLYDDPDSPHGTILGKLSVALGVSDDFCPSHPYVFAFGCWAEITGTTPDVIVVIL